MPFCSTRRPTVMTVGAVKAIVSLDGAAAKGLGRKASFSLGTKDFKRGQRALAVRRHHIGPAINDPPQKLDAETMALQAGVVALGNHSVRVEPAGREHGRNIGLGKKGENRVRRDLLYPSPQQHGYPREVIGGKDGAQDADGEAV